MQPQTNYIETEKYKYCPIKADVNWDLFYFQLKLRQTGFRSFWHHILCKLQYVKAVQIEREYQKIRFKILALAQSSAEYKERLQEALNQRPHEEFEKFISKKWAGNAAKNLSFSEFEDSPLLSKTFKLNKYLNNNKVFTPLLQSSLFMKKITNENL